MIDELHDLLALANTGDPIGMWWLPTSEQPHGEELIAIRRQDELARRRAEFEQGRFIGSAEWAGR